MSFHPHPVLRDYYRADADRQQFVNGLFDSSAQHYDWVDEVLSFGSGRWYRGQVLRDAGLREGMRVCDVAVGTGRVAVSARQIVGDKGLVVGIDPSRGMLRMAQQKVDARFVQAVGEALALRSGEFDFLTMGYALRHVSDLGAAFREYHRVLEPGGRVVLLELTVPESRFGAGVLRTYMKNIAPMIVRVGTRSRDAERMMRYYWETTKSCVPPETIMEALRSVGFTEVKRAVRYGALTEYLATK